MSRKEKKAKRNDLSVKIDAEVYRVAKTVASWNGETIAEYLSRVVDQVARRDFAKIESAAKGGTKGSSSN